MATSTLDDPRSLAFWTGAGISGDAPACLPLGDELTKAIVTATCSPETWDRVCRCFSEIDMRDDSGSRKVAPRLEGVIEHLDRRAGGRITRTLEVLADAQPNDLHEFFAQHIAAGGTHVTMNFDERIEARCAALGTPLRPTALHGRVTAQGAESVRTRTTHLTRGIEGGARRLIEERLRRGGTLVFVGYSGRDYFDVDPFFRSLLRRGTPLDALEVVWLAHAGAPDVDERVPEWRLRDGLDGRPILECLAELGATVTYRRINTRVFLRDLATAWPFAAPAAPEAVPTCPPRSASLTQVARRLQLDAVTQRHFTADLCTAMAFAAPILETESEIPDEVHARSDAHSRVGEFRVAIALARCGADPAQARSEAAALQRIRGAYVSSLVGHLAALRLHYARDPDVPAVRGSGQIEYVNWYAGARRTWASSVVRPGRALLAAFLPRAITRRYDPVSVFWSVASEDAVVDAHPHSIAQLERAHRLLPEIRARGELPESIAVRHREGVGAYVETDSVLGYVNSWRGRLRERLEAGEPGLESELRKLLAASLYLRDRPGVLKARLLLRYAGQRVGYPRATLREIEWTALAKVAWRVRWLLAPTTHRVGRMKHLRVGP